MLLAESTLSARRNQSTVVEESLRIDPTLPFDVQYFPRNSVPPICLKPYQGYSWGYES